MTDYVKTTNFTAKDSLPSGNANKVVRGAEHDTEYDNIAIAIATKYDEGDNARFTQLQVDGEITVDFIDGGTF